jgi:TolA-binding protein
MGLRLIIGQLLADIEKRRVAQRQFKLGNRLYQAGEFTGAITAYRAVLADYPDRPVAVFNLGLALYKNGEKAAARVEWKNVLRLTEGSNPYLREQAQIMLRQFG